MCYSAEVSFGTWGFGMICAVILAQEGKPFLFPLVVSQMQLIEGLRWIGAADERLLALMAKIALLVQPAAAFYEAKQYSFIFPYLVIQTLTEIAYGTRDMRFVLSDDGHFEWKWLFDPVSIQSLVYWVGLLVAFYLVLSPEVYGIMMGLFAYFVIQHSQYNTTGSLWCVWANFMWVYYMLR